MSIATSSTRRTARVQVSRILSLLFFRLLTAACLAVEDPAAPGCAATPSGLITWLPGEGHSLDRQGRHSAVLTGGTTFAPGKVGQSFALDGGDDAIHLGPWFNLQEFTVAFWVREGETQSVPAAIVDVNHTGQRGFVIQNWGLSAHEYTFGAAGVGGTPVFSLQPGIWHHLTLSRNGGGTLSLHLDGVLFHAMNGGPIAYDGSEFLAFGRWVGGGRHWKGQLDEIEIFDRALSTAEIESLVAAGSTGHCTGCADSHGGNGLIGWWTGDGNPANSTCGAPVILHGGVGYTPGKSGAAFQLDGVDDSIDLGVGYQMSAFTYAFWVREGDAQSDGFVDILDTDHRTGLGVVVQKGQVGPHEYFLGVGGVPGGSILLRPGVWQHIAFSRAADGTVNLYVDGKWIRSASGGPPQYHDAGFLRIGRWGGGGRHWRGEMDDLRIYNRPLTPDEVLALAGNPGPPEGTQCVPLPPNLLAWWPADGSTEAHGPDAIPASLLAGATFVEGRVGQAIGFDGVDDVVTLGDLPGLQDTREITLMAWVKRMPGPAHIGGILGKWDSGPNPAANSFLLFNGEDDYLNRGGLALQFRDDSQGTVQGLTLLPENQWVHLAGTWRSADGAMRLYKDGVLETSGTAGRGQVLRHHTRFPARLGEWGLNVRPNSRWRGSLDEAMIFTRALDPSEIHAVAKAGAAGICGPTSWPVAPSLWLRADTGVTSDSSGRVVAWADQSGHAHHALAISAPLFLANAVGGRPAVRFGADGNDSLTVTGGVLEDPQFTIVAVASDNGAGGGFRELLSNWTPNNTLSSVFLGVIGDPAGAATRQVRFTDHWGGADQGNAGAGTLIHPSRPFLLTAVSRNESVSLYQGDLRIAHRDSPLSARLLAGPWVIGRQGALDGEYWRGDLAELLVFDHALSDEELGAVWGRLEEKYFSEGPPSVDLVVDELTAPSEAQPGQPLIITLTAANRGTSTATGPWKNTVWLALDATGLGAQAVGTFEFPGSLPPAASVTLTQTVILPPGVVGPRFLGVEVDSPGRLAEINEANNARYSSRAVTVVAPDLVPDSLAIPAGASWGSTPTVAWRVRNVGSATAGSAWREDVFLGSSPGSLTGAVRLGTLEGITLPQGGSAARTLAVELPSAGALPSGTYSLMVVSDAGQSIAEADESNNLAAGSLTVTLPPLPNLTVSNVLAPPVILPGSLAQLTWTTENRGNAAAQGPWSESVMASNRLGDLRSLQEFRVAGPLDAGARLLRRESIAIPTDLPAGEWQFVVVTDARSERVEVDESDNHGFAPAISRAPHQLRLVLGAEEIDEGAPGHQAVVSRNGDLATPLPVTLRSSAASELEVPATVVIPAGAASIAFPLRAPGDGVVDPSPLVVVTASADGYAPGSGGIVVWNMDLPGLRLTLTSGTVGEGAFTSATLARDGALGPSVTVVLSVDDPGQLAVPTTVTLAAGQASVPVALQAREDELVESPASHTITARAPGFRDGRATLLVEDNDVPSLLLALAASTVSEGDGPIATTATLTRTPAHRRAAVIHIESTDPRLAQGPERVVIPANSAEVSFPIAVTDNLQVDGPRQVAFRAVLRDSAGREVTRAESDALQVRDDDGPTLHLNLTRDVAAEGQNVASSATLLRNTASGEALAVTLTATDPTELLVPASVILPAGAQSVTFDVATPLDDATDGNQSVTVTASATGFTPGADVMVVTDIDLPDLTVVRAGIPSTGVTEGPLALTYRVENRGIAAASRGFVVQAFLSDDPLLGGDAFLGEQRFESALAVGAGIEHGSRFRCPSRPGRYWLILVADASAQVPEVLEDNNTFISAHPIDVSASYTATVETPVTSAPAGSPIPFHGRVVLTGTTEPAIHVPVTVHLGLRGTHRRIDAQSDAAGQFEITFRPLPGEAGEYTLGAAHPGAVDAAVQDRFSLTGLRLDVPSVVLPVTVGASATGMVRIVNLGETRVSGLRIAVADPASKVTVDASLPVTTLEPLATLDVPLTLQAASPSPALVEVRLLASGSGGVTAEAVLRIQVTLPKASLHADPGTLAATMIPGTQSSLEFDLLNRGGTSSGPIQVAIPDAPWLKVASANPQAPLAPGASRRVALLFTPPAGLPLGPYSGSIVIRDDAGAQLTVPLEVAASSESIGTLLVSAVDEFTYYAVGAPRVPQARVTVRDAFSRELLTNGVTDGDGLARFQRLREGHYEIEVAADDHSPFKGTILVRGGQANEVEAFLARQTVRYRWTVVPTTVEDRTRIAIETTFETFVPAPVVTLEPALIDLADFTGSVTQVNLTIRNHGLVAAQELTLRFPEHPDITMTPLVTDLGVLPAQSELTVPITIRRRAAAGPSLASAASTPRPCSLAAAACWTLPCGARKNNYCAGVTVLNVAADCLTRIQPGLPSLPATSQAWTRVPPPYLDYGGSDQTYQMLDTPSPFLPPITFEPPQLCDCDPADHEPKCLEIPVQSSVLNAGLEAVASALKRIPRVELEDPEANVKVQVCTCCDADGVGLTLQGGAGVKFKGKVSFGPGLEVKETLSAHGFDVDAEIVLRCAADFPFEISAAIDGRTGCHLKSLEVCGRASVDLPFALVCEASAKYTLKKDGEVLGEQHETTSVSLEYGFSGAFEYCRDSQGTRTQGEICGKGLTFKTLIDVNVAGAKFTLPLEKVLAEANCLQFGSGSPQGLAVARDAETAFQIAVDDERRLARSLQSGAPTSVDTTGPGRNGAARQASGDGDAGGVCARVHLRLDQDLVMARQAFKATLELDNDSPASALENIAVHVFVVDELGNDVTERFGLQSPVLTGFGAVDGTGRLGPESGGTASWILVPSSEAAPAIPTRYGVGGVMTYSQDGNEITIPLFPAPITVHPDPRLEVTYFHQRDVFGDDPFTRDRIEPSEPFALAVMVANRGGGTARDLRIITGQPRVVENEKGLVTDFRINGVEVEGQPQAAALTAHFGAIAPGTNAIARWTLTSPIQGLFTDYHATFEHLDSLGKTNLSLIDRVSIHEMLRIVRAPGSADDGRPDFLVNDVRDAEDLPDTIHLSNGSTQPVAVIRRGEFLGSIGAANQIIELVAPVTPGWIYLRLPDPTDGRFQLMRVMRSDGQEVRLGTNVWTTDRTFIGRSQRPRAEHLLHLVDLESTGRYLLHFAEPPPPSDTPPASVVASLPEASAPSFGVNWAPAESWPGSPLRYDVFVSTDDGPFQPWLQETSDLSAVFAGVPSRRYAFYSMAIDASGRREAIPVEPDARTTISQRNTAPALTLPAEIEVVEGQVLLLDPTVTDPDPGQNLRFALVGSAPAGLTVDPSTGRLRWPTDEGNGPGIYPIRLLVTDNGQPPLTATGTVQIAIREVNLAPVLSPVADRRISERQTLTMALIATDADLPRQQLTFSLIGAVPVGVSLDPATGLLTWTPASQQGPTTNRLVVSVRDDGTPPLSVTQAFQVIVRDTSPDFTLVVGSTNVFAGQEVSVPLRLLTGPDVTRITLNLRLGAPGLLSPALVPISATLGSASFEPSGPDTFTLELVASPGEILETTGDLARLAFTTSTNLPSALVHLRPSQVRGVRSTGETVTGGDGVAGRVLVLNREPVLVADAGPPLALTLHGIPGSTLAIERSTAVAGQPWIRVGTHVQQSPADRIAVPAEPNAAFYRAAVLSANPGTGAQRLWPGSPTE